MTYRIECGPPLGPFVFKFSHSEPRKRIILVIVCTNPLVRIIRWLHYADVTRHLSLGEVLGTALEHCSLFFPFLLSPLSHVDQTAHLSPPRSIVAAQLESSLPSQEGASNERAPMNAAIAPFLRVPAPAGVLLPGDLSVVASVRESSALRKIFYDR